MKFSEEQITELMQYVLDQRSIEYKILKTSVIMEDQDGLDDDYIVERQLFAESMLRIGKVNALYQLLYRTGAISWDDCMEAQDEVHNKFDINCIREEIRNQRSLER